MVLGKHKKVDWHRFASPNFKPSTRHAGYYFNTCGSSLLSTIVDLPPSLIEKKLPKRTRHWSATAIKNYLKKAGWGAVDITVNSVTSGHWEDFPIRDEANRSLPSDHLVSKLRLLPCGRTLASFPTSRFERAARTSQTPARCFPCSATASVPIPGRTERRKRLRGALGSPWKMLLKSRMLL